MNYRSLLFYLLDFLSGKSIIRNLNDIDQILNSSITSEYKNLIHFRTKKIINHAITTVPFYISIFKDKRNLSLHELPVINKNIIKDHFELFLSRNYKIKNLHKVVTSGSTGTPFSVYQDRKKKLRNTADTIYFGNLAGFQFGTKLNYLKIWTSINKKTSIRLFFENIHPIDVTNMGDKSLKQIVSSFYNYKKNQAFLGYSSSLETICSYLDKKSEKVIIPNVTSVIAMSESLNQHTKNQIYNYFGVHAVSRYSNVENGIIGQQPSDGSSKYIINWASYHVEILDFHTDSQLPIGKMGRIVVTDLFNYAMPMIRYDTGDIGSLGWDKNKKNLYLENVEGRRMDQVFNVFGELVSSFTITNNMWIYPEISQYQFIQLSEDSYLFKININGKFSKEKQLIEQFKNIFGKDANISIEYVNEIPLLNSGKRKKVLNLSQNIL